MSNEENLRLTGVRREIKYLLDPEAGKVAREQLKMVIPEKVVHKTPSSFRVSIYLDDESRRFSNAELENQEVLTKLRIREYYLLEGAIPSFGDHCFLEVKSRSGQLVEKARFGIERAQIKAALSNGPPPSSDAGVRSAHNAFEEMRNGKSLEPIFVVHYRRYTLQDGDNRIRITMDDIISFHIPQKEMLSSESPGYSRTDLPPPFLVEPNWIIEVKTLGLAPLWLDDILDPNRRIQYSKFGTGVRELERKHQLFKKERPE